MVPTFLNALSNSIIIDISCGAAHVLAVTRTGDVYTWGTGVDG